MDIDSHAFFRHALPLMSVGRHDRILEVGCGDGWAARLLAAEAEEGLVIGLDISTVRIHEARVKSTAFENILYLWSAAEEIPWQENFFTLALCLNSIDYFEDPEKALRELYRVLVPGGSVWIVNSVAREEDCAERNLPDQKAPGRSLTVQEYSALLTQCGYIEAACRAIPPGQPNPEDVPSSPGAWLVSARKPQESPA